MVASVGAPASPNTSETATTPITAEMTARVQMARRGDERLGVQHAEVLGSLVVLAHRVGHAGAGVHAASVVPMRARNTVMASASMKYLPWPCPSRASPTMIIMSPMGAAEPAALCMVYPEFRK